MSRPNALKRAATLTIRAGRFAKTTDVSLQASRETPLQRAVNDLKDLGAALEGEGHSAQADQVVKIITELRSENSHRRASQARIFTELLKDATEAEASGMKQWVGDDDSNSPLVTKFDTSATQNSVLASRVMKWTRRIPNVVADTDAGKLAQMLEHDVLRWEFDMNEVHRLSGGHCLMAFGWALFERHGLRAKLDLRTDAVLDFLSAVERGYKDVAYHNSTHGADVTHAVHWILSADSPLQLIVKEEPLLLFTALVGAIVHDLGHDGFNNAFHTNSNSELAVRACYESPLERHHLASTFALLAKKGSMLSGLGLSERKQVHTWLREIVLATDFSMHVDVMNAFKARLSRRTHPHPQRTRAH